MDWGGGVSKWPSWAEWLLTGITVIALLGLTFCVARAEPPEGVDLNSPMAQWYKGLSRPIPGGDSVFHCCDVSDCRPVEARITGDKWMVEIGGKEWEVPDMVIIHGKDNPTGRAVACWVGVPPHFFCFVPSNQT